MNQLGLTMVRNKSTNKWSQPIWHMVMSNSNASRRSQSRFLALIPQTWIKSNWRSKWSLKSLREACSHLTTLCSKSQPHCKRLAKSFKWAEKTMIFTLCAKSFTICSLTRWYHHYLCRETQKHSKKKLINVSRCMSDFWLPCQGQKF